MKITCPHCSQNVELDSKTLITLEGASHFACPTCGEAVAVPEVQAVLVPLNQAVSSLREKATSDPPGQDAVKPSPKRIPTKPLILAGLGVLAVMAACCIFFFREGTVTQPASATKRRPFMNTLGMKFVPVPGTKVLFCIHETRYQDYAAFAAVSRGVHGAWKNQTIDGFNLTDRPEEHPVVNVSWHDVQEFCAWLSKREGKTYRLPTDQEWSHAAGIGHDEKWEQDTTPATILKNKTAFPWETGWPPPPGSGNYGGESPHVRPPGAKSPYLKGYNDGFPTTAPTMSFRPNSLGLYDLSGNVWEWCEDWHSHTKRDRVVRGGSRDESVYDWLLSSCRVRKGPGRRENVVGFRCVLEIDSQPTNVLVPNSTQQ